MPPGGMCPKMKGVAFFTENSVVPLCFVYFFQAKGGKAGLSLRFGSSFMSKGLSRPRSLF